MPTFRLGSNNLYDAVATALTASSAAAGLPVGATQSPDRLSVWRSDSGSGEESIDIDLGSIQPMSMVAVAEAIVKPGGALVLQHRGDGSTPGTAVDVATLPAVHARTLVAAAVFASVSHRHWRLRWTNPGASSTPVELGYAYLGVPLELPESLDRAQDFQSADPSARRSSVDGQGTRTRRRQYMTGTLRLMVDPDERAELVDTAYRVIGSHRPTFAWVDADQDWTAILLELGPDIRVTPVQWPYHYLIDLPWQEAR